MSQPISGAKPLTFLGICTFAYLCALLTCLETFNIAPSLLILLPLVSVILTSVWHTIFNWFKSESSKVVKEERIKETLFFFLLTFAVIGFVKTCVAFSLLGDHAFIYGIVIALSFIFTDKIQNWIIS